MEWKPQSTVLRQRLESEILRVLGDGPSLSRFEMPGQVSFRSWYWAESTKTVFAAALRSLVRRGVIVCEGRYRLAAQAGGAQNVIPADASPHGWAATAP